MPRLARLDAPGVIHHVMIRGIERMTIFRANKDRNDLMDRLADLLPATNTICKRLTGPGKATRTGRWGANSEPRGVGIGEDGEVKGPGPHESG